MSEDSQFSEDDPRVLSVIGNLKGYKLCDHCLGRLVGKIGHGYTNDLRGRILRDAKVLPELPEGETCWLCEGLFERTDEMAAAVLSSLERLEWNKFSIGSRYDPSIIEREEIAWAECGAQHAEPIKSEVNREVGKRVEALSGKEVDLVNPDVRAIIDVDFLAIDVEISPLFIYGRYRKLDRSIPQTKWPCRKCRGKGCERCGFTGKMYPESVEELVAREFISAAEAEGSSFHGMGREDIDAQMLGSGRPFVLELKSPRKRTLDLVLLGEAANRANSGRVEISDLRMSSKEEVRSIKGSRAQKSYMVSVELDEEKARAKLIEVIRLLTQSPIEQRTPNRVNHRRADKVRLQRVYDAELEGLEGRRATIRVRAAAGTYIKELMHGDDGRTHPSLSELLETGVRVLQLDVMEIHDGSDGDGEGI